MPASPGLDGGEREESRAAAVQVSGSPWKSWGQDLKETVKREPSDTVGQQLAGVVCG